MMALRLLKDANEKRRTAEQLKLSFPDRADAERAAARVDQLVDEYSTVIGKSQAASRDMELELAAHAFKFPRPLREILEEAYKELFEFGRIVNKGKFDAADIQETKLIGIYQRIGRMARGWELSNPLKILSRRGVAEKLEQISQEESLPTEKCVIAPERLELIMGLINKRLTSERGRSYAVHPPQVAIEEPALLKGRIELDKIQELNFKIVFQDGEKHTLSLAELMVLTHQLIFLAVEMEEIGQKLEKGGFGPVGVELRTAFSPREIMSRDMVAALLTKIEFSPIPAEAI